MDILLAATVICAIATIVASVIGFLNWRFPNKKEENSSNIEINNLYNSTESTKDVRKDSPILSADIDYDEDNDELYLYVYNNGNVSTRNLRVSVGSFPFEDYPDEMVFLSDIGIDIEEEIDPEDSGEYSIGYLNDDMVLITKGFRFTASKYPLPAIIGVEMKATDVVPRIELFLLISRSEIKKLPKDFNLHKWVYKNKA